jgi:hypothetical protein
MSNDAFMAELSARLTRLADNRPFRFRQTTRAEYDAFLSQQKAFAGLSDAEIGALEGALEVSFPEPFRAYLKSFGKARGHLFLGFEAEPKEMGDYKEKAANVLEDYDEQPLGDDAIVFRFQFGHSFAYLRGDGAIFEYRDGQEAIKLAPDFAQYLDAEVKAMEARAEQQRQAGGYYITVKKGKAMETHGSKGERPLETEDELI